MKAATIIALATSLVVLSSCSDPFEALLPDTSINLVQARQHALFYRRVEDRLDETERRIVAHWTTNHIDAAYGHAVRNRVYRRDQSLINGAAEALCQMLAEPELIPDSGLVSRSSAIETLESILENVQLTDEQRAGRYCVDYFAETDSSND